jgi:hypothetical protein
VQARLAAERASGAPAPAWWQQPLDDLKSLGLIWRDPVKTRAMLSSCTFLAYHGVMKNFIQAVVLVYGAEALGYASWEGNDSARTVLLGAMYPSAPPPPPPTPAPALRAVAVAVAEQGLAAPVTALEAHGRSITI